MNNQVKLIDQSKVDAYIEYCQRTGDGSDELYMLQQEMKAGKFDPDTPPVPTIKPGELVSIKSKPEYGTFGVESLRARIIPTANNSPINRAMIWELDDLEVVE